MAAQEDVVVLDKGHGTSVTVHLFGATVISWKDSFEELLFVSSKSHFDNKKAIRGGIPIVFPHFGPWEFGPQHGFARVSRWVLEQRPYKDGHGNVTAVFSLTDSERTREMWNHKFKLTYTLTLGPQSLKTEFRVDNTGENFFDFTCLLHTYIRVPNIEKVTIAGLKGLSYVDKVRNGKDFVEDRELVSISECIDRIYKSTPEQHIIANTIGGKSFSVKKHNFPDTVVWNPWKEKAAEIADFGDDEYPSMLCVEAGHVSSQKHLAAGEFYEAFQILSKLEL